MLSFLFIVLKVIESGLTVRFKSLPTGAGSSLAAKSNVIGLATANGFGLQLDLDMFSLIFLFL